MKGRFSTIDVAVVVKELKRFLGMRVVNVYDVDNKTYLIKVGKPDEKTFILFESGIRLHSTEFDWPKNPAPSNFSMKLRKHVKGRRLETVAQLGIDRIVDLQFGSNEAAYHVIVELYDRGNVVLTDFEYNILNILRPRTDNNQDVRFAVKEIYPVQNSKLHEPPTEERFKEILKGGKDGDVLKKILVPNLDYGPAVLDHVLLSVGFPENVKIGAGFDIVSDMAKFMLAMAKAEELLSQFLSNPCKGYILQKKDKRSNPKEGDTDEIILYEEFHPFLFKQHEKRCYVEFETFDKAVDEFYSKLESQKLDMKVIQHEKSAMKKLDNVKKDHEKRIQGLQKEQEFDILKGQLIEMNLELVDKAILIVRSALANQIDWTEIWALVKEAQMDHNPVALAIKGLKLDTNQITVLLEDPFQTVSDDEEDGQSQSLKPMKVDLDLSLSAYGNSRKYFDKKKQAAKKEQKTAEASNKAFKSAEKKTKQSLKEVQTAVTINKTRKTFWFEKFLWFISSENYLVIGGRDQQQNEMIVKRYMKAGDLYVHADLHGASSCIIKNPKGGLVPPKTLNEAGTMAICNSAAWDSKVITSAWWVHQEQVSKTAPSGEYLTTGSFMIRGKKNYLPPSYLIYGFGFLFKLEDGSIEHHLGERKVRSIEDDDSSIAESGTASMVDQEDVDLDISEGSSEDEKETTETHPTDDMPLGHTDSSESADVQNFQTTAECDIKEEEIEEAANLMEEVEVKDEKEEVSEACLVREKHKTMVKKEGDQLDFAFPDTNIKLQHVKGDKYELQSQVSNTSESLEFEPIYLGDSQPVVFGEKVPGKNRLSAKQRREMKKGKKATSRGSQDKEEEGGGESMARPGTHSMDKFTEDEQDEEQAEEDSKLSSETSNKEDKKVPAAQAAPPKRGQKAKRKKMKEKYADQDEEERILKMEILASAGSQKKKNKKEKGEVKTNFKKGQHISKNNQAKGQVFAQGPQGDSEVGGTRSQAEGPDKFAAVDGAPAKKEDAESDGEKEEDNVISDDTAVLNSLTGVPVAEDELLYAIPVCAPYNTLLNYKFKVKLMPGNSKKGKAVKTSLNMFLHEKSTTSREKDLLKIQKDVDLSRNMPGKVKVAAPNLHRNKR